MKKLFHHLGSLRLTVALLLASMALVFFGTLDQTHFGIHTVQKAYFESWLCFFPLRAEGFRLPLPGGFLTGTLLTANLIAAHFRHRRPGGLRLGVSVTHAGVLLLIVSGFLTAALQRESMMVIAEGESMNRAEDPRETELAITDTTDPKEDRVVAVPEALLRREGAAGAIALPGTPLRAEVRAFFANAPVLGPGMAASMPDLKPVKVDNGLAAKSPLAILPRPEDFSPNGRNSRSAVVQLFAGAENLGTWLVNTDLAGSFPAQTFAYAGRTYEIALRMKRTYIPFSLRLVKFSFDKHPGTEIPKNFSSDVILLDPREGAERAVTISMNKPLRHDGLTFYQASFNQGGPRAASVLQTVRNPGYLLPYLAVALVGLGMTLHFGAALLRFVGSKKQ